MVMLNVGLRLNFVTLDLFWKPEDCFAGGHV